MEALATALSTRDYAQYESLVEEASAELSAVVDNDAWGIEFSADPYTPANKANLWKNETRANTRVSLEAAGKGEAEFGEWLGDIHFTSVAIYSQPLFSGGYQRNKGWRVSAVGLPAADVVVVGLATHYQGGMAHNRLGRASAVLFDSIVASLEESAAELLGRKIEPSDWDHCSLMPNPITSVADVALGHEEQLRLKEIRTTTVKKMLASFVSIDVLDRNSQTYSTDLGLVIERYLELGNALLRQS